MSQNFPNIPDQVPQRGNATSRNIFKNLYLVQGWGFEGEFPNLPKAVVFIAPHTSNYDGLYAFLAMLGIGVKVTIFGKDSLFKTPLKSLFEWIGVIPVHRDSPHGLTQQIIKVIQQQEKIWIAIAPEGTRKRAEKIKSGFYHIAMGADIPIAVFSLDYEKKRIHCLGTLQPTGDYDKDLDDILARFKGNFSPKRPHLLSLPLQKTMEKWLEKKDAICSDVQHIFLTKVIPMRVKQLGFIGLLGLALVGCDKTAKTPTQTTAIKAREPVIAIALGGGGAKGFAHIGVLKVLESHGIKPKIVTGTSAGSFVGSIYASGKTPYQMQQIAQQLKESDLRDLTLNSQGIVLGQKLQDYVNRNVANKPIEQFPIRFAAVATRLDNGKKAEFIKGNAGQAVRASCSIPNVFVPATIGNTKYVDGGLVSPIPVQTARDMGADIVIAVDISARPSGSQPMNMWGLLDQTINIMGQQSINNELAQANIVIQPKVGHLGTLDLKSSNQAILEGEKAAQGKIIAIQNAISNFKKSPAALKPAPRAKF